MHKSSAGQTINLSDSLSKVMKIKPMPTAKFDSRNSFITGRSARIQGVKAGVSFGKVLTIGLGYNWLGTGFTERVVVGNDSYEATLKLRYIAPFIEYSFYKKGPWEAAVPVQLGFGRSFLQINELGSKRKINEGSIVLYEPVMTVEYKVLNVIGFGGGLGYRIMLKNNHDIRQQFTSPVYVLRIRLIFDEIYKRAKARSEE